MVAGGRLDPEPHKGEASAYAYYRTHRYEDTDKIERASATRIMILHRCEHTDKIESNVGRISKALFGFLGFIPELDQFHV